MKNEKLVRNIGLLVILITGLIHLYDAPGEYRDAQYMGIFFIIFFLGSIISAIGIYRDQFSWGWMLGGLLVLGAIVGYLLSRTVGLPISGREDWGPPLAYFSIILEVLFFVPFMLDTRRHFGEAT